MERDTAECHEYHYRLRMSETQRAAWTSWLKHFKFSNKEMRNNINNTLAGSVGF